MSCTIPFDIGQTSALYAQLTGLLAGFAFTALVLVATRFLDQPPLDPAKKNALDQLTPVLLCAFIGLMASSLTYSVVTGDAKNVGRATLEELIAGLGFSLSATLTLYALVLLLHVVTAHEAAKHGHRILGQLIQFLAFAYICAGLNDYNDAHFKQGVPAWFNGITYGLLFVFLVWAIVGYACYSRLPRRTGPHEATIRVIATATLLIVIACSLAVGFISAFAPTCTTAPTAVALTIQGLSFATSAGFSVWLFLSRPI